jgi:hypothetical protein
MPYLDDTDNLYAMYRERNKPENKGRAAQDLIAPQEHGQFMEEVTARNPIQGAAAMYFAPMYSASKALGITKARSSGSVKEVLEAGKGFGRGLKQFFKSDRRK